MSRRFPLFASTLLLIAGLSFVPSYADTITITLDNPIQNAAPGTTVSYTATISTPITNDGDIYLNGDTFDFGASPFTGEDSGLFANFPVFLSPGDSFDYLLFSITLNLGTPTGNDYTGTYQLQGGVDGSDLTVLGAPQFMINAIPTSPTVPEPSSLVLLGTGLVGAITILRRRSTAANFG